MNNENELRALFDRQAAWQQRRAALPWEEKLRQSLVMRAAQQSLRIDAAVSARPSTSDVPRSAPARGD